MPVNRLLFLLFFHEQRPRKFDSEETGSHSLFKTSCLEIQDGWLIFKYVKAYFFIILGQAHSDLGIVFCILGSKHILQSTHKY